ncbi:MAG: hypothetical protein KGL42_10035 [Betaproteobacteria bacterium]|nr:hypothetical protein [Betaproteobacteria bacterium]
MTDEAVSFRVEENNLVTAAQVERHVREKFGSAVWNGLELNSQGVAAWARDIALVGAEMPIAKMRQFIAARDDHTAQCFQTTYELAFQTKTLPDGSTSVLVPDQELIKWKHAEK